MKDSYLELSPTSFRCRSIESLKNVKVAREKGDLTIPMRLLKSPVEKNWCNAVVIGGVLCAFQAAYQHRSQAFPRVH